MEAVHYREKAGESISFINPVFDKVAWQKSTKNPNPTDGKPVLASAPLAYLNPDFLNSPDGRIMRILSEYAEPLSRFRREKNPGHGRVLWLSSLRQPA